MKNCCRIEGGFINLYHIKKKTKSITKRMLLLILMSLAQVILR